MLQALQRPRVGSCGNLNTVYKDMDIPTHLVYGRLSPPLEGKGFSIKSIIKGRNQRSLLAN